MSHVYKSWYSPKSERIDDWKELPPMAPVPPGSTPPKTGPFAILNVIPEDTAPSYLFPGPGPSPDTVILEPEDGPNVQVVAATTMSVSAVQGHGRPAKPVVSMRKIRASALVTDCRVAVACSNYDKGGGFYPALGGIPAGVIALTANAVSKSRAKKRREGNMMVGHVRYPWLMTVGFRQKTGALSSDVLRLGIVVSQPNASGSLIFDIGLPGVNTAEVARDVVSRAARYRLAHTDGSMPPEERQRAEELAMGPAPTPEPRGYTTYFFYDMPPALAAVYQGMAMETRRPIS
jgi:hypothetical protein